MIRLLTVITLLFISKTAYAQGGFVKFLDSGPLDRNEVYDIYYDEEDNQIFVLGDEIDSSNFYNLKFIKIDTLGEIEWESIYSGDGANDYIINRRNNIVKVEQNKYLVYSNKFMDWVMFNLFFTAEGEVVNEIEYLQDEDDRTTITAQQIKNNN